MLPCNKSYLSYEISGITFFFLVQLVVKSQILACGRGLGKSTSGLQGPVHIVKAEQAKEIAGMKFLSFYSL